MTIARWLPGLATLKGYKASFLPHDLAAGLTLGAVMVPVGLAYGELAGLPMAGLYGSMLPLLAYALFGSSRQLVVGPDTAMAAVVAVAVAPLATGDPGRFALLAAGLGVMVGVLCLLGAVLRLGFVANFLSKPVIVGFMHGLALVIVAAQLPKVLGIRAPGETTLEQLGAIVERLPDTNGLALAIGGSSFAVILLCRRFLPRLRCRRFRRDHLATELTARADARAAHTFGKGQLELATLLRRLHLKIRLAPAAALRQVDGP